MITMKNWRERMSEDMRLQDLRPRTLEVYLLATRLFLECIGKPPEALMPHAHTKASAPKTQTPLQLLPQRDAAAAAPLDPGAMPRL